MSKVIYSKITIDLILKSIFNQKVSYEDHWCFFNSRKKKEKCARKPTPPAHDDVIRTEDNIQKPQDKIKTTSKLSKK